MTKLMMRYEGSFISIFFENFEFLITATCVQYLEFYRISKEIDQFVQTWYWVRFPDCHCVQLTVFAENENIPVHFED